MEFQPDYRHFGEVMRNRRPARLPLYEHIISPSIMEKALDVEFAALENGAPGDLPEFFRHYCRFFREMTYDTVSYEVCVVPILPEHGAIMGGKAGPIQDRADFERYPWDELPELFWRVATPRFDALVAALPEGMKAVGGIGNGVFETSEDLVGLEYLAYMQAEDPELYGAVFDKIGALMYSLWTKFLARYSDAFVACRFGDDLGFKSSLLTNPATVHDHVIPQYRRVIDAVHTAGRPFLWHSCGCIFQVMEAAIDAGIDAKHSNEDNIAPFSRWIADYGDRIALLGGFDMGYLCQATPEDLFDTVVRQGAQYRSCARGYALGSGNSIPDYVPLENYLAMVRGVQAIRAKEGM